MDNVTELEALVARLAAINFSQSSEQATREMAMNPLIAALGWDTFNPDEVDREYSVQVVRRRLLHARARIEESPPLVHLERPVLHLRPVDLKHG